MVDFIRTSHIYEMTGNERVDQYLYHSAKLKIAIYEMASHTTPSLCGASVTVCFGGQGIVWPFQLCECSLWRPNLCCPQPSGNFSHLPPFSIPVGDLAFAICVPNSFKNLKLISILLVHESRLIPLSDAVWCPLLPSCPGTWRLRASQSQPTAHCDSQASSLRLP